MLTFQKTCNKTRTIQLLHLTGGFGKHFTSDDAFQKRTKFLTVPTIVIKH